METRTPLTRYWRDGTRSINYAVQDVRAEGGRGCRCSTGKLQRQEIQISRYPDELRNRIYQPRRGNDAQ